MCFNWATMNIPTNSGRRFFGALLPAFILASSFAWGGAVYTIQNGGMPRQFEVADDEVSIFRKTPGLAVDVKTTFAEGAIVKDYGQRVVVRFAQGDWRKVVGPRAIGGAQFEPVMYEQGQTRTDSARRMVTATVLASGANEAELVRISGAASSKATKVEGYVMLTFASPAEALAGTEKLRKGGLKAEPQLRTQMSKMAIPEIPNDTLYLDQWHFVNTGNSGGLPGVDVNILQAWNYQLDAGGPAVAINGYSGAGVTISILDDSLQLAHVDLAPNVVAGDAHYDFNNGDNDPSPEPGSGDYHGTACAGVAAGRGNNGFGVSGAGPLASIVGLRLISGPASDADFAGAFAWAGGTTPVSLDISSNSWGPRSGLMFGPDILAANAIQSSATTGRGGKGVVFLFAAGNGRENQDDVNMNGYANSRHIIAVGAITNAGLQSYYSNNGSSLLISAPSNGGTLGITTTDVMGVEGYSFGNYADDFGGTSSATPLVAGITSLLLEANPNLGNRDVMEILASTASTVDAANPTWRTNGAGFPFSHSFGGGMADATAAVVRALDWENLAPETSSEVILNAPAVPVAIPDANTLGITRAFNFSGTNLRVEHVEVQLDIGHAHRSDLQITLTSPSGQVSRIIEKRNRPFFDSDVDYTDGNLGWTFSSTQHWGEASAGTWTVNINDTEPGTAGTLRKARVRLFGTPSTNSSRITFDKKLVNVSELAGMANLTVRRVGSLAGAASVSYYISDKTAATFATSGVVPPDGDLSDVSGVLDFAGGEEVKLIQVPIHDDALVESDERFIVVLTNPVGASFGGITVQTVEIDDDEGNSVSVIATDTTAFERNLANAQADNGVFTISRKQAVATPLTIKFTITQPAATPAVGDPNYAAQVLDYVSLPLTATIPAFATSVDVVIKPKDDRFSEGTEIVELILTPDANYNLGLPNSAIVNIVDDDLVPVSVTVSQPSVVESDPTDIIFTIIRDTNQLDSPLSIFLEPSGTAVGGIDYSPRLDSVVVIPAGKASTTVSMKASDNNIFNPLKTVILGVSQGPEYKEGFFRSVEFRIFDDEPVPDAVKPTVLIVAPTAEQRIDHPAVVTASGTATDNADGTKNTNAAQVRYRLNGGVWNVATLTNNDWTADITTIASLGNNVIDVFAIDEAGNESKMVSQKFTYVKTRNLTTNVAGAGAGSITADFAGTKPLEVGQEYTIVAKPASGGNLFDGWSGKYTATTKTLSFTMPDEDVALTATFASALIDEAVIGKFAGNVSRTNFKKMGNLFDVATSGHFNATIGKTGKFSGKLIYGGLNYSVRGEMTAQGQFIGEIPRKKNTPLLLNLSLDTLVAGSKQLTGTVSADGIDSGIVCPKVLTKAEALVATTGLVGSYTFQLPAADLLDDSKPQGTGVGTLKLDAKGNVRWGGVLPDGAKVGQVASLSNDKTWPFFLRLNKGRGVMLGTITQTPADMTGFLNWHKVGDPRDKLFPGGFRIENTQLLGSVYSAPGDGVRVLPSFASGNGTLILEEGNFRVPFSAKTVGITDRNKVTIAPVGADKLELAINAKTGATTGNFIHPVTGVKTKIAGVVLQNVGRILGIFEGSTPSSTALQTGRLSITPIAQ